MESCSEVEGTVLRRAWYWTVELPPLLGLLPSDLEGLRSAGGVSVTVLVGLDVSMTCL